METVNTDSAGENSASATPSASTLMVTWKKNRTHQFPVLELHLAEWVDQANEKHIQVTDDVLRIATGELISMLPTKLTRPGSGRARQGGRDVRPHRWEI